MIKIEESSMTLGLRVWVAEMILMLVTEMGKFGRGIYLWGKRYFHFGHLTLGHPVPSRELGTFSSHLPDLVLA